MARTTGAPHLKHVIIPAFFASTQHSLHDTTWPHEKTTCGVSPHMAQPAISTGVERLRFLDAMSSWMVSASHTAWPIVLRMPSTKRSTCRSERVRDGIKNIWNVFELALYLFTFAKTERS